MTLATVPSVSLDKLADNFLEYCENNGKSSVSIKNYSSHLRIFLSWAAKEHKISTPEDINIQLIDAFISYLANRRTLKGNRLSVEARYSKLSTIRIFIIYLQRIGYKTVSENLIQLPKIPQKKKQIPSYANLISLLNEPDESTMSGLQEKVLLHMLFSTGLRVSELQRLSRSDVILSGVQRGMITVKGKGEKVRHVYLFEEALQLYEKYIGKRLDSYAPIFLWNRFLDITPSREAREKAEATKGEAFRISVREIQKKIARITKRLLFTVKATPHTLRHFTTTYLLDKGVPMEQVMEILGHASFNTTLKYRHYCKQQLQKQHGGAFTMQQLEELSKDIQTFQQ